MEAARLQHSAMVALQAAVQALSRASADSVADGEDIGHAAMAVALLTKQQGAAVLHMARYAIPPIGRLLSSVSRPPAELVLALHALSERPECIYEIVASNSVPGLVRALARSTRSSVVRGSVQDVSVQGLEVLGRLFASSSPTTHQAVEAGVLPALARLLDPESPRQAPGQAAVCLELVALSSALPPAAIVPSGLLGAIGRQLARSDDEATLGSLLGSLRLMARSSRQVSAAMTGAGAVGPAVALLGHDGERVRMAAAAAVANMCLAGEARAAVLEAGGVALLLRGLSRLRPLAPALARRYGDHGMQVRAPALQLWLGPWPAAPPAAVLTMPCDRPPPPTHTHTYHHLQPAAHNAPWQAPLPAPLPPCPAGGLPACAAQPRLRRARVQAPHRGGARRAAAAGAAAGAGRRRDGRAGGAARRAGGVQPAGGPRCRSRRAWAQPLRPQSCSCSCSCRSSRRRPSQGASTLPALPRACLAPGVCAHADPPPPQQGPKLLPALLSEARAARGAPLVGCALALAMLASTSEEHAAKVGRCRGAAPALRPLAAGAGVLMDGGAASGATQPAGCAGAISPVFGSGSRHAAAAAGATCSRARRRPASPPAPAGAGRWGLSRVAAALLQVASEGGLEAIAAGAAINTLPEVAQALDECLRSVGGAAANTCDCTRRRPGCLGPGRAGAACCERVVAGSGRP
jgi:hypothetical protein